MIFLDTSPYIFQFSLPNVTMDTSNGNLSIPSSPMTFISQTNLMVYWFDIPYADAAEGAYYYIFATNKGSLLTMYYMGPVGGKISKSPYFHNACELKAKAKEILHADDDFDLPLVTRTQTWKLESHGLFWRNGNNVSGDGEITLGSKSESEGVLFTVEQSDINNQVIFSDGKGNYVRAVKTLPYVVLEFGSNKKGATSFIVTWLTEDSMILSSTGTQSPNKSSSRTWITHGKSVYLSKESPSRYAQDKTAIITVHRQ